MQSPTSTTSNTTINTTSTLRSKPYTWPEVVQMIFAHKRELVIANIIAILGTLSAVPIPLAIPFLVDEVLLERQGAIIPSIQSVFDEALHHPITYISVILVLTLLLRVLNVVFNVWQTREFTLIAKNVIFKIRRTLLLRLQRFSMAEYETLGSSTVASHLVTDLDAIDDFVSQSTSKFIVAVLSLVGTAIVLLWIHWQLGLFIILLNPAVIYLTTRFGRKIKKLKRRENSAYQLFQESLAETLDAIQQIRASNRERHYIKRVIDAARNIRDSSSQYHWKSDAATRLSFMTFLFGFDVFRALSMITVLYSDLSIGEMMAVYAYLWFMMGPVQEIVNIQYSYHSAKAALERINRLIDVQLEPQYTQNHNPFHNTHTTSIELQGICFRYGDGPLVLNDLDLKIQAGEKVALVGASGGGKTTLVQILLGLYLPTDGQVYFNGVPISQIGLDVVRDNVATVLQHPALLNDSVRNNLTLGKDYADEKLWHALETAQLKQTIEDLDAGLDTLVGRDGIRLSGGQRQRLAVARMVLSNPKIVILDEATSALDTQTEGALHKALQTFLRGKTTIIVAHRLSAVKQADRALVFDEGRIIEDGSHEELIDNGGLYASLYKQQDQKQLK